MKVYTKVVIDILSMKVKEEHSYEYFGDVSLCKDAGSSTTTTVDTAYNAGMLALSEEQQTWAREMYNQFKYGVTYDPNEQVTGYYDSKGNFVESDGGESQSKQTETTTTSETKYNPYFGISYTDNTVTSSPNTTTTTDNRKYITKTRGELNGYDSNAQVSEMQYLQNQIQSENELLGLQSDLTKQQIGTKSKLYSSLYDDIMKSTNINEKMNQAQAEVQQGFKNADKSNTMTLASYGLDPSSGMYTSMNRGKMLSEATGIAASRTAAKQQAELDAFNKKLSGLQVM